MTVKPVLADLQRYEETVDDMFRRAVAKWPARPFLIADGREIRYLEMEALVARAARGLAALGVRPGDRVALWMSNTWEWVTVQFAVTRIGAVLTPLNTRLRSDDLAHALNDSGAAVLVTQVSTGEFSFVDLVGGLLARPERLPALRHVVVARPDRGLAAPFIAWDAFLAGGEAVADLPPPATDPRAMAYILYTSGTTSLPKGVMLAHASLNNAINHAHHFRDGDRLFLVYPLFAITGCHNSVLVSVVIGGAIVLQERFNPSEALALIDRHKCTVIGCIVSALEDIAAVPEFTPARVASLRSASVFPRRPEHRPILERIGVGEAPTGYGMTETGAHVTFTKQIDDESLLGEGVPWPGDTLRLVTEDGREAGPGEPGAILVRSPHLMLGYFNNPEATAKALDKDGFLHTGDVGMRDEKGRLTWLGRVSDIIKCSGFNYAAQEVEAYLQRHTAIEEISIVGVPDRSKGEVGAAFVVLRRGATLSLREVQSYCHGRIASYKMPGHLFIRPALPKTASGKIRKVELKEWFVKESAFGGGAGA